ALVVLAWPAVQSSWADLARPSRAVNVFGARRPPVSTLFPYTTLFRSFGVKAAKVGRQPERFEGAVVWVLPNPSGLNANYQLPQRSEEHTSELQSPCNLVCRLLLEKKKVRSPAPMFSVICSWTIFITCC